MPLDLVRRTLQPLVVFSFPPLDLVPTQVTEPALVFVPSQEFGSPQVLEQFQVEFEFLQVVSQYHQVSRSQQTTPSPQSQVALQPQGFLILTPPLNEPPSAPGLADPKPFSSYYPAYPNCPGTPS